ncbi:bifunctional adenosylcobinamide kinase/adenosylcobinamide-phosphate guanylyltransferase, partial [Pseudomonas syringae]|uniref:bifunctional adenosylcobinamide kinase/adenosylcobinamide-phosphate guanylyltransferase n=1 Tax=Pseudomonas syringae TaxID=317 RepID=UPI000B1BEFDE
TIRIDSGGPYTDESITPVIARAIDRNDDGRLFVRMTHELTELRKEAPDLWFVVEDDEGRSVSLGDVPARYASLGALADFSYAQLRDREAPHDLIAAIDALAPDQVAVVDCLTLWLSNLMAGGKDVDQETDQLCATVAACPAPLFLVSNEVGWGVVPDNALARAFRDHAGRLHQRLAAQADEAVLIVAGLPL